MQNINKQKSHSIFLKKRKKKENHILYKKKKNKKAKITF